MEIGKVPSIYSPRRKPGPLCCSEITVGVLEQIRKRPTRSHKGVIYTGRQVDTSAVTTGWFMVSVLYVQLDWSKRFLCTGEGLRAVPFFLCTFTPLLICCSSLVCGIRRLTCLRFTNIFHREKYFLVQRRWRVFTGNCLHFSWHYWGMLRCPEEAAKELKHEFGHMWLRLFRGGLFLI